MNGAEAALRALAAAGVDTCFANPGTTELAIVDAFDAVEAVRPVLCLDEAVVAGAADGWARMRDTPAAALLHLGPGLANALAQLHDARRARSPIVALIGDHTRAHRPLDSPITMDVAALARTVAAHVLEADADEPGTVTARALRQAGRRPGRVVAAVLPADVQWAPADPPPRVVEPEPPAEPNPSMVALTAEALRRTPGALLLLDHDALTPAGLRAAARVASGTGCAVRIGTFPARLERGGGLPAFPPLPYPPPAARAALDVPLLVLCGAEEPVAMFGAPDGEPGRLVGASTGVITLARPEEAAARALEALAELVGAEPQRAALEPPPRPSGSLDPETLAAAVAWAQPEGAIVVDEGVTSTRSYLPASAGAPPSSYLRLTGGALGFGLPAATGAAVACPHRRVVSLQADGSAMYALPALWTQAREGLAVTTVLCVNARYRILEVEMSVAGIDPGPAARRLVTLEPPVDWIALARGFGIPAVEVDDATALANAVARSIAEPGPALVVARMA